MDISFDRGLNDFGCPNYNMNKILKIVSNLGNKKYSKYKKDIDLKLVDLEYFCNKLKNSCYPPLQKKRTY